MKALIISLISLVLSYFTMYIIANAIEEGDKNAVGMYFLVFYMPLFITVLINGLYIYFLNKLKSRNYKMIFSFLPAIMLALLSQINNLKVSFIDGNLNFVAQVCLIGIGIANVIWMIGLFKVKKAI